MIGEFRIKLTNVLKGLSGINGKVYNRIARSTDTFPFITILETNNTDNIGDVSSTGVLQFESSTMKISLYVQTTNDIMMDNYIKELKSLINNSESQFYDMQEWHFIRLKYQNMITTQYIDNVVKFELYYRFDFQKR